MQAEGAFTTSAIKEHARRELVDILDSVRGKKGLVLDPSLSGPLSLIAEFSLLKVCRLVEGLTFENDDHFGISGSNTILRSLAESCLHLPGTRSRENLPL